jgi:hypothetical protein
VAEFSALNTRVKERENRQQFAVARLAAALCSSDKQPVSYELFLPHPPPPTFIDLDSAQKQLTDWVKAAGGIISEKT